MVRFWRCWVGSFIGVVVLAGCSARRPATVVWISVDGFRSDYLDRARPPAMLAMAREGAVSRQAAPVFPSLTFPNHIAQATGTTVNHHGIVANGFFDRETGQSYSFPEDTSLLRAEPIWITAKRQGLRVFVNDWPVSQVQSGPLRVDYAPAKFDAKRSDAQRLDQTIALLNADKISPPPRLIMTYVGQLDGRGHQFGPDDARVDQTLLVVDKMIARFKASIIQWFEATHGRGDELYIVITTDHGMQPLHTRVSLDRLLGADLLRGVRVSPGGTMNMLYLLGVPERERDGRAAAIIAKLKPYAFVSAWRAEDVPRRLHFSDRSRVGDVIVTAAPGYIFASDRIAATMPVVAAPLGAHGYDPGSCPNMLGTAIVWRYRQPIGGRDIGRVENTQWHASVARWLGINPAAGADGRAIDLGVRR